MLLLYDLSSINMVYHSQVNLDFPVWDFFLECSRWHRRKHSFTFQYFQF